MITATDGVTIGEHFKTLKNLRYAPTNPRGVAGMTKINANVMNATYLKARNGFHFRKEQPAESHVLVQAYNAGLTASQVFQNTTAVPGQGNFSGTELHADGTGAGKGRFSDTPGGYLAYCNGAESCLWGGDESPIGAFINYAPDNDFSYDYTKALLNTKTDSQNVATLYRVTESADANTMLLLHLDNNVTDSSPTTIHTVTNNNATFSTSNKVFGTHGAVFNGTTAYLSVPDNADFDFSAGAFTLDARVRPTSLAVNNSLYYQKTDVLKVAFTSGGTYEIEVGDTVTGHTSSATAIVDYVDKTSGTWAGGDAAGDLYVHTQTGTFEAENLDVGANEDVATIAEDTADAGDNYIHWYIDTNGAVKLLIHECYGAGSDVVSLSTANSVISANTFYHIELVESASDWYIFVDGIQQVYANDASRAKNYISVVQIGYDNTNYFTGNIDEYRVSNSARHVGNFELPSTAYGAATYRTYIYLGAIMPLDGFKAYIGTANTTAGTMSVDYWGSSGWTAVSSLSDGTAASGKPLAQTGSVTFTSTATTARASIIKGLQLYWYRVSITELDTTTTLSHVTVSVPFQDAKDIWDGIGRNILSFQKYDNSTYNDGTLAVFENVYDTGYPGTFIELDSLATTDYLVFGFGEQMMGISIHLGTGAVNTTANTVAAVYYGNGDDWTTVGTITDGTSEGGISFAKNGIISWTPPSSELEFKQEVAKTLPLYHYKIQFTQALSGDVKLYFVYGIPAQKDVGAYKFPAMGHGRLWLCGDQKEDKNKAILTAYETSNVFNGSDTTTFYFGSNSTLTAAAPISNQFGSTFYNIMLFWKDNEVWRVIGNGPEDWVKKSLSSIIGCPAPLTIQVINTPPEMANVLGEESVVWQGADGVYITDGRNIIPLHNDIEDYFDNINSHAINRDKTGDSVGFYDESKKEYHWLFANGTSTTLNKELVYSFKKPGWFEIDRGTEKYLQAGFSVMDTDGNKYQYGMIDTGYMERLEYGTDFDGTDITHTFQTGDIALHKDEPNVQTTFRGAKLVMVAKDTTSNEITLTHYGDTKSSGTDLTLSPANDGYRIAKPGISAAKGSYNYHGFKFVMITDDEDIGFEPVFLVVKYMPTRED